VSAAPPDPPQPCPLIPAPAVVRDRLYRLRAEATLLARLLRLSEDCAKILPRTPTTVQEAGQREGGPHVA